MDQTPHPHLQNEYYYQEPHKGLLLTELASNSPLDDFYRQILMADEKLCHFYVAEGMIALDGEKKAHITGKGRTYLKEWHERKKVLQQNQQQQ